MALEKVRGSLPCSGHFHIIRSDHGKPGTVIGNHTQGSCHSTRILLLHYCLLLILLPYPVAVKAQSECYLGFCFMENDDFSGIHLILRASWTFSSIFRGHNSVSGLGKWERMRMPGMPANQMKQGSLRETELLAQTPRSQAFLHLAPHPALSAMLGIQLS